MSTVPDQRTVEHEPATSTAEVRRRAGSLAAVSAIVWFTSLAIEHRFGLFPDQETGGAVVATQITFFAGMLGWAAALVMLLRGNAVRGRFATFALGLQCLGLLGLVAMGLMTLGSGSQDSPIFPIAGLSMILGGVLTGIALFLRRVPPGAARFAGLLFTALMLIFMFGGVPPTFISESMLPLAWFILGGALWVTSGHDTARDS